MQDRLELVYEAADELDLARATAFLKSAAIPFWTQRLTDAGHPSVTSAETWMTPTMYFHGGVYARVHVPEKYAARAREVFEVMLTGEPVSEEFAQGDDEPDTGE
ncbi:MAG: hypothetical protein ACE5O2_07720 [Armatimonadota bacterium]